MMHVLDTHSQLWGTNKVATEKQKTSHWVPHQNLHIALMVLWSIRNCAVGCHFLWFGNHHYTDVTMSAIASHITSLTIVFSVVYWGADQRKHQSSTSLAFVRGIHRGPVNSPHKGSVTRKMFPFDDVIMTMSDVDTCVTHATRIVINTFVSVTNI